MNKREAAHEMLIPVSADVSAEFRVRRQSALDTVRKMNEAIDTIEKDAKRLELDWDAVKKKPADQRLLKIAAEVITSAPHYEEFGPAVEVLTQWTLSSYAHAQSWAAHMTSRITAASDGTPVRTWNPDVTALMQGFQVAWDLMYGAFDRFVELAGAR